MYQKLFDQSRTGQIASAPVQTTGGAGAARRAKRLLLLLMLCAALPWSLNAQDLNISGTVLGANNDPVVGASVVVKGTTAGAVTGTDGSYNITAPANATLVFSFLGLTTKEEAVDGRGRIDVVLNESDQFLDEVVVVGYGVQKKRDLTGAVSSIKMNDAPVATFSTISHALAGKAAGLQVTQNSAQVGGGSTFRIRGATSPSGGAGNEPLIILDGFPVTSPSNLGSGNAYDAGGTDNVLESINPNDIESIEVLKDASATAIYGSRAGHGVIIITTKRGSKDQRLRVNYSGNVSVSTMKNGYDMLDASQYMAQLGTEIRERYLADNGLGVYANYKTPTGKTEAEFDLMNTANYAKLYDIYEKNGHKTTDYFKEVTRTGVQQSHNVSLSGGTEATQYLASINYFGQEGIVKNNAMNRLTANVNLDQQISKYVKGGLSLNLSRNQYDNSLLGNGDQEHAGIITSAIQYMPILPVYDENGEFSKTPTKGDYPNPVSLLDITDKSTKDRVLSSAYLEVKPVKELTLKTVLGMDRKYQKRKQYVPTTTVMGAAQNGIADIGQSDNMDYLLDLTATYIKEFGDHNLTALAGYSFQQFNQEGFSAGNSDFPIDGFLYNNLATGNAAKPGVSSWADKSSLSSYFARVNYSFLGRYLLTATLRADGDSDFTEDNRWGYFPSASVGWRFSDEAFMQSLAGALSNGKLRASYGQTGNSNIGNNILDAYGARGGYVFGSSSLGGVGTKKIGNRNLTWETTTEFNIGLDLGLFKNRINLSVEYYDRVISDLLATKSLPSYNELGSVSANIGKTQGQGFELTLNTVNVTNKDFVWTTDLSLSTYKDRWLERDPDWTPNVYQSETDYIRSIFVYRSDGIMQAGETAPAWQSALLPGQLKVKNLKDEEDALNKLDPNDVELLGSEDPALIFGFNNTIRWKQLDFNIYFYGELGRWRGASYYEKWTSITGNAPYYNVSTNAQNTWRSDNQGAAMPSLISNSTIPGTTDFYYKKISYLRCRNITVGYTIPVSKKVLNSIRVYADVNNPFVITNWTGVDPETDFANSNNYAYPNVTSFSLGVDINF
ncbi:MAG: TonB-dependent receptor [Prevotellaceae bacterium]|nr:TonB-dependent receptor [Prevotellaceae bacterium]